VCHFRLDTRAIAKQWSIDFRNYFATEIERLQAMEKDGLLALDGDIVILEPGRLLVRNICMIFDRFQSAANSRGAFSRTI
jgi:oxygen-independent coproporphyrinogen-3 oxidase